MSEGGDIEDLFGGGVLPDADADADASGLASGQMEYEPSEDSPPWMVRDWPGLAEAFSLTDDVVAWHAALAGQGRPWTVIRRIYGVAPLWGEHATTEDAEEWDFKRLSAALGVQEKDLRQDLADAAAFWTKVKAAGASLAVAGGDAVKPLDGAIPDFSFSQELSPDQIDRLLSQLRFRVHSESSRLYVARRILELRDSLMDPNKRESARQLIVMEIKLQSYEDTQMALRDRQESIMAGIEATGGSVQDRQAKEIQNIAESLDRIDKAHTALQKNYFAAADDLGADSREESTVRKAALGTISHLTEAHRLYYKDGNRDLIDGMFAADEVEWQLTPLEMRPAQYRPDIVIRAREALTPENLWGPNYEPTSLGKNHREACRRLLAITRAVAEEFQATSETIPGVDDVSPGSGGEEADEDDAPLPEMTARSSAEDSAVPPPPSSAGREADEDDGGDCMAME